MKRVLFTFTVLTVFWASITAAYAGVERVTAVPANSQKYAPIENIFQLAGSDDKFIILDDTEDGYFVLAHKYYARSAFDPDGLSLFDVSDENNIGWWLNNTFLTDTSISRLPQDIIDNIQEHTYITEGGGANFEQTSDYETTCKVVLLSQTEWLKYNGKLGYADDESYAYWYLRTTRESTGNPLVVCQDAPNTGLTGDGKPDGASGVRPAFYLPHDFFNKVKVDYVKTGDSVIAMIRKHSDKDRQSEIYTPAQLTALFASAVAPQVEDLYISGRGIVGEAVNGSYKYVSLDGSVENGTVIKWVKGKSASGPWSVIIGADTLEYTPRREDVGYYLSMQVTPANRATAGKTYTAKALSAPVKAVSVPEAHNIQIVGEPVPTHRLEAKYHYYDANNDLLSSTKYQWQVSEDDKSFSDIDGADKRFFTVSGRESGKYVRVLITPMKKQDSVAGRETPSASVLISDIGEITAVAAGTGRSEIYISKMGNAVDISVSIHEMTYDVGEIIASSYEAEGNAFPQYVWQRENDGVWYDIENACQAAYTITEADIGKNIRLSAYTQRDEQKSKRIYSEPIWIKGEPKTEPPGDSRESVSFNAHPGVLYEIWIDNKSAGNTYAYSMNVSTVSDINFTSDSYIFNMVKTPKGVCIAGTKAGNVYAFGGSALAGILETTAEQTVTVSDIKTAGIGSGVSGAALRIHEKVKEREQQ